MKSYSFLNHNIFIFVLDFEWREFVKKILTNNIHFDCRMFNKNYLNPEFFKQTLYKQLLMVIFTRMAFTLNNPRRLTCRLTSKPVPLFMSYTMNLSKFIFWNILDTSFCCHIFLFIVSIPFIMASTVCFFFAHPFLASLFDYVSSSLQCFLSSFIPPYSNLHSFLFLCFFFCHHFFL